MGGCSSFGRGTTEVGTTVSDANRGQVPNQEDLIRTKRLSSRYEWRLFARDANPEEARCTTRPTRRLGSTASSSSCSTGEGTTERRCSSSRSGPSAECRRLCFWDGRCSVECLRASPCETVFVTGLSTAGERHRQLQRKKAKTARWGMFTVSVFLPPRPLILRFAQPGDEFLPERV